MPFDIAIDTPTARRQRLIWALRREMPPSFSWNFAKIYHRSKCGAAGCAIGLAYELGICDKPYSRSIAKAIGITPRQARKIFIPFMTYWRYGVSYRNVTPAMVADALESVAP